MPWFPKDVDAWSVRWVLFHMIEELARHAGQADIIRETIDGATLYELLAGLEDWETDTVAHAVGQAGQPGRTVGVQTRSGTARCGDVELYYEDLGDPADPPVLLIMGVGAQLPMWPDGFCEQLVERGYRVIRFDHRDIGLSTKMQGHRADGSVYRAGGALRGGPQQPGAVHAGRHGRRRQGPAGPPQIDRAHVVGASMGGMIAQVLAANHPDRVQSLGIIMSSSGRRSRRFRGGG